MGKSYDFKIDLGPTDPELVPHVFYQFLVVQWFFYLVGFENLAIILNERELSGVIFALDEVRLLFSQQKATLLALIKGIF